MVKMNGSLETKLKEPEIKRKEQSIERRYNADYKRSAYKILESVYVRGVFIP